MLRPLLQTFWESRPDLQQQLLQHQQAAERSKAKALKEEAAARKAELKEQTLLKE